MNTHHFYIVSTNKDAERNVAKGGETEDPYMRIKKYGTSRYPDDPFRYRCLLQVGTTDKTVIRRIEKRWLAKFDDIECESEDEEDLNRASTTEGIKYTDEKEFLSFFMETLRELQMEGLFIRYYETHDEINSVLRDYRAKQVKSKPIQSKCGLLLRPYQIEDIQNTLFSFQDEKIKRGYWSIECGLGKTVMAFELILQMKIKRTFFIVPRNTLLHQVLRSFISWKYSKENLYFCSGSKLPEDIDCVKVDKFSQLPRDTFWICVITYDSLPKMKNASVNLTIFDEGHHLVPSTKKEDLSGNLFGLSDENIQSDYRLTITATPKNTPLVDVEKDETTHIGMSHQPELYGICLAERNYTFGRDNGYLAPFEVVCIKTEATLIRNLIQRLKRILHLGESTFDDFLKELEKWEQGRSRAMLDYIDPTVEYEEETIYSGDIILWYAIIADLLIQAIQRYQSKKIITYHTTKIRASLFKRIFEMIWNIYKMPLTMTCDTVHSGNTDAINESVKNRFKANEGADVRILCNIRTLIEGFDEPSVDTTLFADNKWSAIEAKQIIGRGNRKDPKNPIKFHRVLIPFLSYEVELTDDLSRIRTTNDYRTVRYTVKNIIMSLDPNQTISQTVWVPKAREPKMPKDEENEEKTNEEDETERVWIDENTPPLHDEAILGTCPTQDLAAQSFQKARLWMHELARNLSWNRFVGESQITSAWNQYRESHLLPKDIPHDPSKIYKQVGWINMRDYVGVLTKREEWQELHAGEMLELLCSKRINLFDHTLSTLRTQVESILTRKLPAHPKAKWKISLYDLAERVEPNSTHELRKWGQYPDKLYNLLSKEGITDAIDFERLWPSLHTKYPNIPGIPSEVWSSSFWDDYKPNE